MIETWLKMHRLIYTGATRPPFILTIRDGTVDHSHFKTWLRHYYLFVRAFVPFAASLLIKAYKESDNSSDIDVVLSGMAALSDEIAWLKREASKWGVSFSDTHPQKANQDYCRLLESLMRPEVDYTVAITAFWAIEAVYEESFAHCLEEGHNTPPELQETCQRWGNEEFGQYCHSLKVIANRRLKKASDNILKESEVVFLEILEHEVKFWNISSQVEDQ